MLNQCQHLFLLISDLVNKSDASISFSDTKIHTPVLIHVGNAAAGAEVKSDRTAARTPPRQTLFVQGLLMAPRWKTKRQRITLKKRVEKEKRHHTSSGPSVRRCACHRETFTAAALSLRGLRLSTCFKEGPLAAGGGAFEALACQLQCHMNASAL